MQNTLQEIFPSVINLIGGIADVLRIGMLLVHQSTVVRKIKLSLKPHLLRGEHRLEGIYRISVSE